MSAEQDAVAAVVKAWRDPGPRPDIHRAEQERLRREWPSLARAVRALAEAAERRNDGGGS